MSQATSPAEISLLARRLDHLLRVEGYGTPVALACRLPDPDSGGARPAYLMADTSRALAVLGLAALGPLERALGELGGQGVPEALRQVMAEGDGPATTPPSRDWAAPALAAPAGTTAGDRIRSWIARLLYLARHEGFHGPLAPGLIASRASQRLTSQVRPYSLPYLLAACEGSDESVDREAICRVLHHRHQDVVAADCEPSEVVRRLRALLAENPWQITHAEPELVDRFIASGLFPAGFEPPPWGEPSVAPDSGRNR